MFSKLICTKRTNAVLEAKLKLKEERHNTVIQYISRENDLEGFQSSLYNQPTACNMKAHFFVKIGLNICIL